MVVFSPKIKLNNGQEMPIVGLGTWGSPPGQVATAIKDAIDAGYRLIDGAHVYENEHEVGEGINAKINEGVIKREDVFVVNKVWNTSHRADTLRPALLHTLKQLNLSYLDLYLIHWPIAYKEGDNLFPNNAAGVLEYSDADWLDTWKEMEKAVDDGLVKSIGVSNFNKRQVERLLDNCRIKPVTNQIECHPYLTQKKLSNFCYENGIIITAYSPLGSPNRPWVKTDDDVLLDEPKLKAIATKYNKDPAQILIRYQIQRGHIVIPKSVTKSRVISNFQVFDFKLAPADITDIESFECNGRLCPMSEAVDHKYHPFTNDEY